MKRGSPLDVTFIGLRPLISNFEVWTIANILATNMQQGFILVANADITLAVMPP